MIEAGTVLAVARITITEVYDGVQGEPGVDANLLEWVEEWNSNLTMIDSNMVVTPKIFAGVKNSSNTITGVALGNFSMLTRQDSGEFVVENVNGLYGFWEGLKTFSIDSSGDVTFGRNDHYIKYTASTGLIEFGAGVAMAWVGATYIDKDGIFTGTLSADSVNAISLSAVQITSGTLSADRIAAGSITATHLDATSIKSSIINTDYINGLSCTFTKGTVGGWSIASGVLSCGQIALNATSKRIAVYGSTSSATSGHRVQFYYTSDSSFGFYATNSSGTCIAQLGSANQIAGWQITSSAIYKNSVYLGSDGSLYNGTKWKLANDGSGFLAGSNIVWDASGNVTFGSAVSLLWSAPISELSESIDGDVLPKLTQINSSGIYTGTLSATQITAGTINSSLIDTESLKAAIINATNINALTLTVIRGTIGGWSIGSGYIAKDRVYLGADGSIYNGTKWQLNNDGSGSIASGNISWDISGKVTFSTAVSLNWQNDILAAQTTNYGYPYYKSIVIYGEEDVYYPVILKGGDQTFKRDILIRRAYDEQAPNSWYSTTHKGGLVLLIKSNYGCWGGISYSWDIYELSETYCNMFAGALHCANNTMFAVFLRGGGSTGAKYHIYSNQVLESDAYAPDPIPIAPQVAYDSDLIFSYNGSVAYAPMPRTYTDEVKEEIRSKRFIYLAQTSDTTLQEHPLTYIGSTGIYTGTLTANQVNAVAISASSITTGTLSADRIAAGSIYASKLNAASIQADIINATYISGLTCEFTKGTIGGWTIEGTRLSCGQLVLDDANHRIAVFTTSASATSGQRTQLYYNSNTDYGFLSTDSSGSLVAQFGSYNRVAGWNITSSYIYKNSIYLGADGSIYNSSNKWRLNNDGSGSLASGNISWDTSGNVSFASSVALNWTTLINQGKLYVRGTGYNNAANRLVILNGTTVVNNSSRGLSVTVINRDTLAFESTTNYDVYSSETYCTTMATHLDNLSSDKIVVITSCDAIRINETLNTAIQRCGGNDYTVTNQRYPYALIGIPTIGKNNGIVVLYGSDATEPHAEISTNIENGIPIGINTNGKMLTYISGTGIYTGTLTADQITAGTINAARIDTASIKTAILTATNVNALTLTTTKGTIGGWNISSSYIYKNTVYFGSDGSIYNGTKWKLNYDGSGQLAGGNISWDTSGGITAKNAQFTNVRMEGSVRNPYVLNDSSIWIGGTPTDQENFNNYDNVVVMGGSFSSYVPLPWTLENSGRRITLLNYRWNSSITTGSHSVTAPTGQYFFEDGVAKSTLNYSREFIELMGYGDDTTFFGWIVVNRLNLMTSSRYGKPVKVLAQGRVTGTSSSASITYKTFDNTTMSVTRTATGKYTIYFSSLWGLSLSSAVINLTGYGYSYGSTTAPIKASVYGVGSSYMYVHTSDDASGNDGSFFFQIMNMNDWVY